MLLKQVKLALLLWITIGAVTALDLDTQLLSMDLNDVELLETESMSCATPQSEFERVSAQMAAWADIVQHKDSLNRDIDTLESLKTLIQKKKISAIEKKLAKLELPNTQSKIGEPILAEFRNRLKDLNNPETADECEATLLKLCIYLIKQFNSCRQQCQTNPVTVIKIKGKIKDLQVIQQGCGQPAPCDDEPALPEETQETEETPEVPDAEETQPVPDEEEPIPEPIPEEKPVDPDIPIIPGVPAPEPTIKVVEPPTPVEPTAEEEQPQPTPEEEQQQPPALDEEEQPQPTSEEEELQQPTPEEEQTTPSSEEEQVQPTPEEEQLTPEEETTTPEEQTTNPEEEQTSPEEEQIGEEPPVNPDQITSPEEETSVEESQVTEEESYEEFSEPPIEVPTDLPLVGPVEKSCLNSVNEIIYTASVDETSPLVNKQLEGDNLSCYGFGFYVKWLQAYPTYLVNGRQDERYFVARITENEQLSGQNTDEALAVYLTKEGFEFTTYDGEGLTSTVISVGDIEGEWVYLYYSYCNGEAVAIVNEGGQTTINQIQASHTTSEGLNFILAGPSGDIKSFQGQFALVQSNVGENTFISTPEEADQFIFSCNSIQEQACERQISNLHDYEFNGKDTPFDASKLIENTEPVFAQEYSISGWFKWVPVQDQASWHTAFRLTLNNVATNQNAHLLGDRDLALFVGNQNKDSILAFTTYTYTDLYGNGNPTYWQAVPYEKDLVHWHFVYFGYSRHLNKAYGFVEFFTRKGEVHFENVKHFDSPNKILYVGQDQFYPSYSGRIFNLHYNLCDGSYRELHYDEHWGYTPKPSDPQPLPEPEPQSEEEIIPDEPKPEIPEEPSEPEETYVEPLPVSEEEQIVPEAEEESEESVVPPVEPSEEEAPEQSEEETPEQPEEETPEQTPEQSEEETPQEPEEETPQEPEVETPQEPEEEQFEESVVPPEQVPDEVVPEPEPTPPAPFSVVPQPQCPPTIEINKDNAADILCELSHYLGEFAQGHTPVTTQDTKKVCFCMTYNEDYAPPTLLQLASKLQGRIQMNEQKIAVPMLKKFIKQRQ